MQANFMLVASDAESDNGEDALPMPSESIAVTKPYGRPALPSVVINRETMLASINESSVKPTEATRQVAEATPAEVLFSAARELILRLLVTPMKEADVATMLEISSTQAKTWLQRLVAEGVLEKQKKPISYVIKQRRLFEC